MKGKIALGVLIVLALIVGLRLVPDTAAQVVKLKKGKVPPPPINEGAIEAFKDDQRIIREANLKPEGPDLLEYFKSRTLKAPDPKDIAALVRQLGDEDFHTREKAFVVLTKLGASALAGIKEGENDADLEIRKRVAELRLRIDTKAEPILQSAAARVIAKTKPAGAADVLMAYLPFASDPMVIDEICRALGAVALVNGKAEPVLVKALTDPLAVKRGAAGEALARANSKDDLPEVKKLLKDADINVRFRVCMAMIALQDKEIVPVMIDLLGELSPNQLWPIEEALFRLAGEKAPPVSLGNDPVARKNTRDAWAKWYAANEAGIDMTKLTSESVYLGYTLIVQQNNRAGAGNLGEVYELDKNKMVRWKFAIPNGYPVDAQVVREDRVLVCEYQGGRVTERDLKGEIKWEHACGGNPFSVQRLPNGNTFIVMQARLIEVDRDKKEVWTYQRPNSDIMRARKLPNGEVAFVTNQGAQATYTRMDAKTQKVNKQFQVVQVSMLFGNMDVLNNGNVLIAHYNNSRVVEYNQDGQQVNTLNLQLPNSVMRLPNGNNLITSYNQRRVYEYNNQNQMVWDYQTDGNVVFTARRR